MSGHTSSSFFHSSLASFIQSVLIIEIEGDKTIRIEDQLLIEQPPQQKDENKEQNNKQASTSSPPFPERLVIS